eukprot:scaffold71447_cov17-Prasinocladus_malaysianus.AAC.1
MACNIQDSRAGIERPCKVTSRRARFRTTWDISAYNRQNPPRIIPPSSPLRIGAKLGFVFN